MVDPLEAVRRAAAKAESSRVAFLAAIRAANAAGRSLREIAKAAGISHEAIRRIIKGGRP